MQYKNELELLLESFKKIRLRAILATADELSVFKFPLGVEGVFERELFHTAAAAEIKRKTLYKLSGDMKLRYRYLLLPDTDIPTVLFIGPYLSESISPSLMLELAERCGIAPKRQRYLEEYYSAIPIIPEGSPVFSILDTFLERIWKSPSFLIIDHGTREHPPASVINETGESEDFRETILKMKTIEKRYSFENEMIRAVSLGQLHKEGQLLSSFSEAAFEKRTENPLRNMKNYSIIMNTLLRKAAESGGVHPLYIDSVSRDFAFKIEALESLSGNMALMTEMFRSYCRLVHKHALKSYSPLVQSVVLIIDSDLSAELSLATLAKSQSVSPGYLSTVFHKETGKTLTEYIRDTRITHAEHLLTATSLQIQTVALHCGILDVQYFSKIFKRKTGKTPKEYREALHHSD